MNPCARQALVDRTGTHPAWELVVVGALSYLLIGVGVTNATTPEPTNPWARQSVVLVERGLDLVLS